MASATAITEEGVSELYQGLINEEFFGTYVNDWRRSESQTSRSRQIIESSDVGPRLEGKLKDIVNRLGDRVWTGLTFCNRKWSFHVFLSNDEHKLGESGRIKITKFDVFPAHKYSGGLGVSLTATMSKPPEDTGCTGSQSSIDGPPAAKKRKPNKTNQDGQGDTRDEPKVSFAILTANDMEKLAVTNYLQLRKFTAIDCKIFKEVRGYNWCCDSYLKDIDAKVAPLPDGSNYQVFTITVGKDERVGVHFHCEHMGPWGAQDKTAQVLKEARIRNWKLDWIFVVGCCGASVSDKKQKAYPRGTVLIANQIQDYLHTGKLETVKSSQDADSTYKIQVDDQSFIVKGSAQAIKMNTKWLDELKGVKDAPPGSWDSMAAVSVNYLSGPLVIKDAMFSTRFRGANVEVAGVEMEVVGVIKGVKAICDYAEEDPPTIVLAKGISDYTSGKGEKGTCTFFSRKIKRKCTEDELQLYATMQSIALVIRFVARKIEFI